MRHALSLPPFGALSDIGALADIAARAEGSGWNGVFLWDHILRPESDPTEIADTWIALTAIAAATNTVRIGPMITPLTRRRPQKLAREVASLDGFSNGRMVLGLGLGVDTGGELTRFGETVDPRVRADRLDEGVDLMCLLWSGDRVEHRGEHFVADGVTMLPTPVQRPRVPLWFAARGSARRPIRRAARYDGLFPVDVEFDDLRSMIDAVVAERGSLDGFDIACHHRLSDGSGPVDHEILASAGVTWLIHSFSAHTTISEVEAAVQKLHA